MANMSVPPRGPRKSEPTMSLTGSFAVSSEGILRFCLVLESEFAINFVRCNARQFFSASFAADGEQSSEESRCRAWTSPGIRMKPWGLV